MNYKILYTLVVDIQQLYNFCFIYSFYSEFLDNLQWNSQTLRWLKLKKQNYLWKREHKYTPNSNQE